MLKRVKRYFISVTISRRLSDIVRERDLWVYSYKMPTVVNNSIKIEVGIENSLHIEFEYNKSKQVEKYNMNYTLRILKSSISGTT